MTETLKKYIEFAIDNGYKDPRGKFIWNITERNMKHKYAVEFRELFNGGVLNIYGVASALFYIMSAFLFFIPLLISFLTWSMGEFTLGYFFRCLVIIIIFFFFVNLRFAKK